MKSPRLLLCLSILVFHIYGFSQSTKESSIEIQFHQMIDSVAREYEFASFVVALDENQHNFNASRLKYATKHMIYTAYNMGLIRKKALKNMKRQNIADLNYPVYSEAWMDSIISAIELKNKLDSTDFADSIFHLLYPNRLISELTETENVFYLMVLNYQHLYSDFSYNFERRICYLHRLYKFKNTYYISYFVSYISNNKKRIVPGYYVNKYGLLIIKNDLSSIRNLSFGSLNDSYQNKKLFTKLTNLD